MNRWAILDPDTHEVLTVVVHDDAADQAAVDAHAAHASSEYQDAVERVAVASEAAGQSVPVDEATSFDIPVRPVGWFPPDSAVRLDDDDDVATGDIYDPTTGVWSRPEPARPAISVDLGRLLTGLYAAGAVDDAAVAGMVGDDPDTTYTLVGDPPVLVRAEG